MAESDVTVAGLLLAAGQGSRMGRPKALVHAADGTSWLRASRARMLAAGCADVLVVLGAEAERAAALLGGGWITVAERWSDGLAASLAAGLTELSHHDYDAALVHLVDLPDVTGEVMQRVVEAARPSSLARAVYDGSPGHPVVVGRDHWLSLVESLDGDSGAKRYLDQHGARLIECGDLATGRDVDTADKL